MSNATPKPYDGRVLAYRDQSKGRPLTPKQQRRLVKKHRRHEVLTEAVQNVPIDEA